MTPKEVDRRSYALWRGPTSKSDGVLQEVEPVKHNQDAGSPVLIT